jgi:UrcA family protein
MSLVFIDFQFGTLACPAILRVDCAVSPNLHRNFAKLHRTFMRGGVVAHTLPAVLENLTRRTAMSSTTSNTSKSNQASDIRALVAWILVGALATIVTLATGTPAWSATPAGHSVTVSFRDLDISTPEGAKVLYRRIQAAANQVCDYPGADAIEHAVRGVCYRTAIADAVAKVNSPILTAVHTGRPAPMTAMLAK